MNPRRHTAWASVLAVLTAGLLAWIPVAQAICDLELLVTGAPIGVAQLSDQASGDGPFPDLCHEDLPSAMPVGGKFDSSATGAGLVPDQPLYALPNTLSSPRSPRLARTRSRLPAPPPELPFRRCMRLLI